MVIAEKTFEEMRVAIGGVDSVTCDVLVPYVDADMFETIEMRDGTILQAPCKDYISDLADSLGANAHAVEEAIFNAFGRGNNNQGDLPVSIAVLEGPDGYILRITDSGKGFDYEDVYNQRVNGQRYWQNMGFGFEWYDSIPGTVWFEGRGNTLNMEITK